MAQFFETRMGQKLIEVTLPNLVKSIQELTKAINKQNELLEKDIKADTK